MLEQALAGLVLVLQWPAIGFLFLGVMLGLYLGAVPGLSGLVGMAILLPFTFGMDPVPAFAFLLGMFAVTTTSDTIASVLLGVPGTAASQATILDGYPMAQRGEAARAFGAAFTVSAVGGVLGAVVLALSIPVVKPLILAFASPEFFMLGVLGLTLVGSLSGGSMLKGLAAALLGLLFAMVGYSSESGIPRFHFGWNFLLDGLPLIPVVIGLFAIPEAMDLVARRSSIADSPETAVKSGILDGVRDAGRHWWLVVRSTAIGVYIGMLPGLGGSIVDWVAYGHAVQSAKDKSRFGKGDVRGVIAPETANNAMKGGALIPTLVFGIPGNTGMALLLGAFLIQDLTPGPQMLTTKLHITFSMIWTLVIANIVGALLLMVWARQVAKITHLSVHMIVPAVILFVFMGAWMTGNQLGDWYVLLLFGFVGLVMKLGGWPRAPLILGFILGPIMENTLYISSQAHGLVGWVFRPMTLAIGAVVLISVLLVARRSWRERGAAGGPESRVSEGASGNAPPALNLGFSVLLFALFVWAGLGALRWPIEASFFPLVAAAPGVGILIVLVFRQVMSLRSAEAAIGAGAGIGDDGVLAKYSAFYLGLIGIVVATVLVGQQIALPLFIFLYLLLWGKSRWWVALLYAGVGWVFMYLMFDRVIHILWYPSLLGDWIG